MNTLVFDTEYVWVEGCERTDKEGNPRSPHPPNAVIESIAYVAIDYHPAKLTIGVAKGEVERDRVQGFVAGWVKAGQPRLVTFGGRQADVPLIAARLMHHGTVAPEFFGGVLAAYRFRHENQLDLYDVLGSYGANRAGGLDDWARCIGWPGKGDTDGSKVAELLKAPGGRERVNAYCLSDAVQTAAVLLRYELATGSVDPGLYAELAAGLLAIARKDPRTASVGAGVDEQRFLTVKPREAA